MTFIDDEHMRANDPKEWLASPEGGGRGRRRVVEESWGRAIARSLNPETVLPPLAIEQSDLEEVRQGHALAGLMPLIRRLLLTDIEGSGLVVAVGDERGRLLWVEGDSTARSRAEDLHFMPGADWSENTVGTAAPGTALVIDRGIQIHDDEHFGTLVHGWSCTAVPLHDPQTHEPIGVIDITGDSRAVDPFALTLLKATAAAAESELTVRRLTQRPRTITATRMPAPGPIASPPVLRVSGRDVGELVAGDRIVPLSARHATILAILAWNARGMTAQALREAVYADGGADVTLRAELARLRRVLQASGIGIELRSNPYRLSVPVEVDAQKVLQLVQRGAHRAALSAYEGPVLTASSAPGLEEIRTEVLHRIRDAMLGEASADVLVRFAMMPEAADDIEVLREALRLLPPRSPKRLALVAKIEAVEG